MNLPCKQCKKGKTVIINTLHNDGLLCICPLCCAVYDLDMEDFLMATKLVPVSICDRIGCSTQFEPKDGMRLIAKLVPMEGNDAKEIELCNWELSPECVKDVKRYFSKRMTKTNNSWANIYDKRSKVNVTEEEDNDIINDDTSDDTDDVVDEVTTVTDEFEPVPIATTEPIDTDEVDDVDDESEF